MQQPIRVVFFLLTIALSAFTLDAQSVEEIEVSGFEAEAQEQSNWCWAASIQSLFLTKGLVVDQTSIVTAAYGRPINATAPGFDGTLRLLNSVVVDVDGDAWYVRARAAANFPNAEWLLARFENDEPVMVWFRDPYANHSIVLHGGTYYTDRRGSFAGWQSLTAYDPLLGHDMTIDAPNIPRFVYGTFEVAIRQR
jgi:hypothetical protein